jgi:predicted MFS family arabinose efflux permease
VPLYPVYALLFADAGLSVAQISTLFALWSGCAMVLEVPSGAVSDMMSRRTVLLVASLLRAAAFGLWMVAPSYLGFAVGFVVWAASGALISGAWEALTYEHLEQHGASDRYATVVGRASSAAWIVTLLATFSATPLLAWGDYGLVAAVSVVTALIQAGIALALPRDAPRSDQPTRFLATIRAGVGEAARSGGVRLPLLAGVLLAGLTGLDEYVPLLLRAGDVSQAAIPLLLGLLPLAAAVGGWAAGVWSGLASRAIGVALVAAAMVTVVVAAFAPIWGLIALAVWYGMVEFARVVADVRLQHAVRGPARATVTSVAGFGAEVAAVLLFLAVAGIAC